MTKPLRKVPGLVGSVILLAMVGELKPQTCWLTAGL